MLVDCGNGVFSKLRPICDYVDIDAVVITHMHADHFLDLVPFSYALRYAPRQRPVLPLTGSRDTPDPARPRLYLPAGGHRGPAPRGELLGRRRRWTARPPSTCTSTRSTTSYRWGRGPEAGAGEPGGEPAGVVVASLCRPCRRRPGRTASGRTRW